MFKQLGAKVAGLSLAVICAAALFAPAARAVPITFNNVGDATGAARFTIGCGSANGSCVGLLEAISSTSPVAWSSSYGLMLVGSSEASPLSEMAFLNSLLDTNFTSNTGNISLGGSGGSANFSTDAQYLMIKVGGGPTHQPYGLLQNISGGSLDLFFAKAEGGQAGGMSHYITFGTTAGTTQVPEPGVLAPFGFGLLLLAVSYGLRRQQSV